MSQRLDAFSSQPWWQEIGHDATADILKESVMDFSSDRNIWFGSKIINSEKTAPLEEAGAQKLTGIGVILPQDGLVGSEQQQRQQASSSFLPSTTTAGLVESSKQELLDQSMAYGSNRFSESFYGGAMPTYLSEALPHLHCPVGHSSRAVLPLEAAEEPVYVNAKQYHGILRRRQSRAKAELKKKPVEVRRPYLHESRHLHAMRRARGCGGRFLSTKKLDNGSSAANASTGRDSSMSSEKTGSMQTAIGSLTIK